MSNAWFGVTEQKWPSSADDRMQSCRPIVRDLARVKDVPGFMISGTFLSHWEEESSNIQECVIRTDPGGFFLIYQEGDKDAVCIDMCHISDCRGGIVPKDTRIREFLNSMAMEPLEQRSITFVYGTSLQEVSMLHFVSSTSKVAKDWIDAINALVLRRPFSNPSVMLLLEKQHAKIQAMVNANSKIPVRNIIRAMNATKYEQRLWEALQGLYLTNGKNDEVDPSEFTFAKFFKLYETLCPRQDLDQVFSKSGSGKTMYLTLDHLVRFLNDEQRDPRLNEILHPYWNKEKTSKLIQEYEPTPAMAQKDRMSMDGWTRFLMSEHNVILKPDCLSQNQDMSHPLTHYFINSSHNTYLVGRQLGGKSSVEMYRQCLLAGCRCIELDCWDGPGDEPIITHGNAFCTNILFKDVIYAIKETAFVTSPHPVLLSFENHCLRQQQRKLASYCIDIFGDLLLTKNLDDWPLERGKELPPPNKLLYKILIKNKKLRPELEQGGILADFLDTDTEQSVTDTSADNPAKVLYSVDSQDGSVVSSDFGSDTNSNDSNQDATECCKLRPPAPQKRLSVISEQSISTEGPDCIDNVEDGEDTITFDATTTQEQMGNEEEQTLEIVVGEKQHQENSETTDKNAEVSKPDEEMGRIRSFTAGTSGHEATCKVVSHMRGSDEQSAEAHLRSRGKLSRLQRSASFDELPTDEPLSANSTTDVLKDSPLPNSTANGTGMNGEVYKPASKEDKNEPHFEGSANVNGIGTAQTNVRVPTNNRARLLHKQPVENAKSMSVDSIPKATASAVAPNDRQLTNILDLAESKSRDEFSAKRKRRFAHSRSSSGDSSTGFGTGERFMERGIRKTPSTVSAVTLSGSSVTEGDIEQNFTADDEKEKTKETRSNSQSSFSSQTSQTGSKPSKKNSRATSLTTEDESEMMVGYPAATKSIDPLLSSLVNYLQPTPFTTFDEAEEQNLSFKMSSFNETSAYQLVRASPVEFARYNKKQFSRIYPKGTRIESTNYNPQVFWNVGCQMVSLNLQTSDLAFQLNQGKFEANGQCGYILKPEVLRRPDKVFDPFMESPIDNVEASSVSVKVISGQFLTDKKCNTYVIVDMYGLPADTKRKNKTKIVGSNFMNTLYNEEAFVFNKVVLSELALLRFAVYDENDRLLGQRVVPLNGIQPGYRHLPLRSESNVPLILPTLFVYITVKTYVPERFLSYIDSLVEPMKYQSKVEKREETLKVFDDEDELNDKFAERKSSHATQLVSTRSVGAVHKQSVASTTLPHVYNKQRSDSTLTISLPGSRAPLFSANTRASTEDLHTIVQNGRVNILGTMSAQSLKRDKNYQKILKKHQKELEALTKRHEKERASQSRNQEYQVEKMKSVYVKTVLAEERTLEKTLRKLLDESQKEDKKLLHQQKLEFMENHQKEKLDEFTNQHNLEVEVVKAKQEHEEAGLRCYQAVVEVEYLRRLLHTTQEQELKEMKENHDSQTLELERKQTRKSIEDTRQLNMSRNVKSKEEIERLQRELNKTNVDMFKQERGDLRKIQETTLEELVRKQQQVLKALENEFKVLLDVEKQKYRDATVAKRKTCAF